MRRAAHIRWVALAVVVLTVACQGTDRRRELPRAGPRRTPTATASPAPSPTASPTASPTPTAPGAPLPADLSLALEPVVTAGLDHPTFLTSPPGDPRLFVLEQTGRVRIVDDGRLLPEPFLDITADVLAGGERGLLGLEFHPRYPDDPRFFVHYTRDPDGATQVVEFRVSGDADRADPTSRRLLAEVAQPASVHNGGTVTFGPGGLLYLGLGDGGWKGDPHDNAQDRSTLLGSIVTIDVDADRSRAQVLHYGLRNPWRITFDVDQLYIADVGQYRFEEIDVVPADAEGLNFGWPIREGSRCYPSGDDCRSEGLVAPVLEYPHDPACAVIGGYVYRGRAIPELQGHYLYTDYCDGSVRSFAYVDGAARYEHDWTADLGRLDMPTSFGRDADGELYIVLTAGEVHRVVARR